MIETVLIIAASNTCLIQQVVSLAVVYESYVPLVVSKAE